MCLYKGHINVSRFYLKKGGAHLYRKYTHTHTHTHTHIYIYIYIYIYIFIYHVTEGREDHVYTEGKLGDVAILFPFKADNFTTISLSLTLNVTIVGSNPKTFSSQSHAAT
jgi:hypothetical protein